MKILSFLGCLFLMISINAQSKKELEDQIIKLNTDVELLKVELTSVKNKNQEYSDKLADYSGKLEECRSKYELCTEDKLKMMERQNSLISQNQKLQVIIDSLKAIPKEVNPNLITNPKNREDSMRMAIQKYFLSSSIQERLKHVIADQKTADRMATYYSGGIKPREIIASEIGFGKQIGEYFEVFANNSCYYLKNVNGQYAVNWEASVGHNDQTIKTFQANQNSSVEVRVVAELSNFYNYNYNEKQSQYLSIALEDPVNGHVWAYVSRNSALGKTMLTLLADGKGHRIIVQIAADRSEDESGSLCILTQLVSDNWLKN